MLFELIIQLLADYADALEHLRTLEEQYHLYAYRGMLDKNCQRRADGISTTISYQLEVMEELEEILAVHGLKR